MWKRKIPNLIRCSKSSSKTGFYSDKCIHQGTTMISNEQPNFTHQGTRKRSAELVEGRK